MSNVTLDQTVTETEGQALRRLLAKAKAEGVRLGIDTEGNFWASSTSQPGHLHAVTATGCGCKGFAHRGRCKHVAALLSHLGRIDPDPAPTAPACPECDGDGVVEHRCSRWYGSVSQGYSREWGVTVECERCAGTGIRPHARIAA